MYLIPFYFMVFFSVLHFRRGKERTNEEQCDRNAFYGVSARLGEWGVRGGRARQVSENGNERTNENETPNRNQPDRQRSTKVKIKSQISARGSKDQRINEKLQKSPILPKGAGLTVVLVEAYPRPSIGARSSHVPHSVVMLQVRVRMRIQSRSDLGIG